VPLKNATVEFIGTKFKKKFKHVNPGEMIFMNMPNGFVLNAAALKSITINIRGDRQS
jgi:hypothetical protein